MLHIMAQLKQQSVTAQNGQLNKAVVKLYNDFFDGLVSYVDLQGRLVDIATLITKTGVPELTEENKKLYKSLQETAALWQELIHKFFTYKDMDATQLKNSSYRTDKQAIMNHFIQLQLFDEHMAEALATRADYIAEAKLFVLLGQKIATDYTFIEATPSHSGGHMHGVVGVDKE